MITTKQLFDLYTHYVSETNKWKSRLEETRGMKSGAEYYINDEISNLLWQLYIYFKMLFHVIVPDLFYNKF